MAKRSVREFGRFDVDFLESEEYLRLPERLRNVAYLYLLALSGRSRKRRTDGILPMIVAEDLATRMGQDAKPMLVALGAKNIELVRVRGKSVIILKYSKWQQTKTEIEEVQADARERKAKSRAGHNDVTTMSHISHTTEEDKEEEEEEEEDKEEEQIHPSAKADVARVFEVWVSSTGRSGRTLLDSKRRDLIHRALRAYPLEDVLDAVDGWQFDGHHSGQNDRGRPFNDLELILRDAKHIEQFRDFKRQPRALSIIPKFKPTLSDFYREQAAVLETH